MGRWFAEFSKRSGWDTIVTDLELDEARKVAEELGAELAESNAKAAAKADVVLIAVPIDQTPKVVKEVAGSAVDGTLLLDVASIKEDVVRVMKEIGANVELASLHPLFGPGAKSIKDRTIVTIPVETGEKYRAFKKHLESKGAKIEEMGAEEHDRLMRMTQSMTHFLLLSYVSALKSMKDFERAERLQTPLSDRLFYLAKAFLNLDPGLCADLQTKNKYAGMARSSILEACRSLDEAFNAGNIKIVEKTFDEARELLGREEVRSAYERLYEDEADKE